MQEHKINNRQHVWIDTKPFALSHWNDKSHNDADLEHPSNAKPNSVPRHNSKYFFVKRPMLFNLTDAPLDLQTNRHFLARISHCKFLCRFCKKIKTRRKKIFQHLEKYHVVYDVIAFSYPPLSILTCCTMMQEN